MTTGTAGPDGLVIGVALFDDVVALDSGRPWEVFATWGRLWPDDGVRVLLVAEEDKPIRCVGGLQVLPDHTWDDVPRLDVLVYPGGPGAKAQLGDAAVRTRLRSVAAGARVMASVCTGALVLADAGLLDGRPATTHWASVGLLAEAGRDIEVREGVRYVDAGDVVTSAGVTAGLDLALHLVARLHSEERAAAVARALEYEIAPEA